MVTERDIIKLAVTNSGKSLKYASKHLQNDREIVFVAVYNQGGALQYASDRLKDDKDIVQTAQRSDSVSIRFASYWLRALGRTYINRRDDIMEYLAKYNFGIARLPDEIFIYITDFIE